MQAAHNRVVSILYRLCDDQGQVLEESLDPTTPLVYLHGHKQMIRGFERALDGATSGEKRSFQVLPAEGYGFRNVEKLQRVPAKYLRHEGRLAPGKVVRINTENGVITGTIFKVGKFNVDVDMNHPLAGQVLHFDVEVVDVRPATAEEMAHGHVHGAGGCGH